MLDLHTVVVTLCPPPWSTTQLYNICHTYGELFFSHIVTSLQIVRETQREDYNSVGGILFNDSVLQKSVVRRYMYARGRHTYTDTHIQG